MPVYQPAPGEPLHCLDMERQLWATTRCGGVPVKIFKNTDSQFKNFDGNTMWRRGRMEVDINAACWRDKARLQRVLLHEFTHVVEYCNSAEFLSPDTTVDNCTELAQAMEDGLDDLWRHFKRAGRCR